MASMSPIFFCFLRAGVNFPAPVFCLRQFRMSGPSLRLATSHGSIFMGRGCLIEGGYLSVRDGP